MRAPLVPSLALLLTLAASSPALAQQGDAATKTAARVLAEDGVKLLDKGDYPAALEKLSHANDLVHAPTMAYLVGQCLEKLGRLVEASEKYLEATQDVIEAGASPAQRTAQASAEKARLALLKRIPTIELTLDTPAPDAAVVLDGKQVQLASLGVKRFIDPGTHTAVVIRWGQQVPQGFTAKEGDPPLRLVLKVPVPAGAYPPPVPGYAPPGYPPVYAPVPPRVEMKRRNMGMFVGGVVLIPLGSIGILGGGALALVAGGDNKSAGPGVALLVLGAGAVIGGGVMVGIGGKKVPVEPAQPAVSIETLIGPGSGGIRVRF